MYNIVKELNGNVNIYDATSGELIQSVTPEISNITLNERDLVVVEHDNESRIIFDPEITDTTQILPAASIAFTGNGQDLFDILQTMFYVPSSLLAGIATNIIAIEAEVTSKINRIQGASDYNLALTYDLVGTENILTATHTGTTAFGVETIVQTITYVNPAINGSNITNILYS
jgi:hypothetical protein